MVTRLEPTHLIGMRFSKFIFLLFLALSVTCSAQAVFPDTPAGHQSAAWLGSSIVAIGRVTGICSKRISRHEWATLTMSWTFAR